MNIYSPTRLQTGLYYNRDMVLYSWKYVKIEKEFPSLSYLAGRTIMSDNCLMINSINKLPRFLQLQLLRIGLMKCDYSIVNEILSLWPFHSLVFEDVLPDFGTTVCWEMLVSDPLKDQEEFKYVIKHMMKCCSAILMKIQHLIEEESVNSLHVDLGGFPINVEEFLSFLQFYTDYVQKKGDTLGLPVPNECIDSEKYVIILNCTISRETMEIILKALHMGRKYKSVVEVHFSRILLKSVPKAKMLEVLDLLDPKNVKALDLRYNNIHGGYISDIALKLCRFQALETLVLAYNSFDLMMHPMSVSSLGSVFQVCNSLKHLDLSSTRLTDKLELLLNNFNHGLELLNIRSCHISRKDISYLATSAHAHILMELDLSNNNFTTCIGELIALLDAMANQLTVLHLEHIYFRGPGIYGLVQSLCRYNSLRFLNFKYIDYSSTIMMEEVAKLGGILSLEILHISDPAIFSDFLEFEVANDFKFLETERCIFRESFNNFRRSKLTESISENVFPLNCDIKFEYSSFTFSLS